MLLLFLEGILRLHGFHLFRVNGGRNIAHSESYKLRKGGDPLRRVLYAVGQMDLIAECRMRYAGVRNPRSLLLSRFCKDSVG